MRWSFLKTIAIHFACISIEHLKSNLEGVIKPLFQFAQSTLRCILPKNRSILPKLNATLNNKALEA
jgi:hypothetical protein